MKMHSEDHIDWLSVNGGIIKEIREARQFIPSRHEQAGKFGPQTNERLEYNTMYAEALLLWKTVELLGTFPYEGFATEEPVEVEE